MQWAHLKGLIIISENFIKWIFNNDEKNDINIYGYAAGEGQINVLKWIKKYKSSPSPKAPGLAKQGPCKAQSLKQKVLV